MAAVPLDTEADIRTFVALCLKSRTPSKLAQVMPDWLRGPIEAREPELAVLRETAERLEREAARARRAHVKALTTWIDNPTNTAQES